MPFNTWTALRQFFINFALARSIAYEVDGLPMMCPIWGEYVIKERCHFFEVRCKRMSNHVGKNWMTEDNPKITCDMEGEGE